jgi:NitT/TauT family transport system permease protein
VKVRHPIEPAIVTLAFLALWELLARVGALGPNVPAPTHIVSTLVTDMQHPLLWHAVGESLYAWALGLAIVVVIAVPLGVLLGSSDTVYRMTSLTLNFFWMLPITAALPLLVFIAGVGLKFQLYLVLFTAIWPLLVVTMYGVHDVDPLIKDASRAYGVGGLSMFRRVVIPSAFPYIATGLRLSAIIALLASIAASLIAGGEGLGSAISSAADSADPGLMYARTFLCGLFGLLVTYAFTKLEQRALRWHPSQREALG